MLRGEEDGPMPFNERSRLDTSQVQDRRGRGLGTAVAVGGGGLGLVVLLVAILLGVNPGDLADLTGQAPAASTENASEINNLEEECRTGADANTREDCRVVGFVNSIQAFWTDEFARQGAQYIPAKTAAFHGVNGGRLWIRYRGGRAVLLSGRPEGLSGPRLLRRTADALWRSGRPVRRGVRAGSRVRSSRAEPHSVRWTRRAARAPRGRRARQFRLNSRLTAWPASGRTTPPKPAT